jgi:hypothetical protein
VAQLNSAPDYGSGGCRFESCRGHHKKKQTEMFAFFIQSNAFFVTHKRYPNKAICHFFAFDKSNRCLVKLGRIVLLTFARVLKIDFCMVKNTTKN